MRLLIDTHILIWSEAEPWHLPSAIKNELDDRTNEVLVSVVSFWEIVIKVQTGKMIFARDIQELADQQVGNGLTLLPVTIQHVTAVRALPAVPKDPFDRLLIAQAITEGATLVSADGMFTGYPIPVLW